MLKLLAKLRRQFNRGWCLLEALIGFFCFLELA